MIGFKAGALYAASDKGAMLLQVFSDFDIADRTLAATALGKGRKTHPLINNLSPALGAISEAKVWSIESQQQYDYAFATFFRPFAEPSTVRNKPGLDKLVLIPIELDKPIIPNDIGDTL